MEDPANDKRAATSAAARWKRRSTDQIQADDLKGQIIATFRLQKACANKAAGDQGTAAQWRSLVQGIWTEAFKDDPIPGCDFKVDSVQSY